MKRTIVLRTILIILSFFVLISCTKELSNEEDIIPVPKSITLFREVLFYDGYASKVNEPVPSGIYRVSNSKYVTQVTKTHIDSIGEKLNLEIIVKAACDNYDRIGNVFLSILSKGDTYDKDNILDKIEVARFITPFMDKNKQPDRVSYSFEIDNIAKLLTDDYLANTYDFWMEFDIFGVPYAANQQIDGCAGRNDTFYGTLKLVSTDENEDKTDQYLVPIVSSTRFNNYKNTDILGETIKSFDIELTSAMNEAKLYLITSNHGANQGGEEYIRREHYIYFDGSLLDSYIPGGKSCEPYRKYNTQGNGIYGSTSRSDAQWASWSNWCPGDIIPIRIYDLGNLNSGNHTLKIEVPDAEFVEGQGDIPLSAYIQGDR